MSQNKKTLVIVESPNKVKKIQSYLGPAYIVKATVGHIMDLVKTKEHKYGIDFDNSYNLIYDTNDDKKKVVNEIKVLAKGVDEIIIATDPDREGCCIAFNVKSFLEDLGKPIFRAEFHEITKPAITKAIANPVGFDANMFKSQQARRALDRIVGFDVSGFAIKNLGRDNSAGRVQSVAVRLVVDRQREIENFLPEEYWNITASLAKEDDKKDSFIAKLVGKVLNKTDADKIKTDLDVSNFKITKVDAKQKNRNPYPPFNTAKLLQAAAGRYNYSAAKTSKIAQKLFESGYITYIRTDSFFVSPEAQQSCKDYLVTNNFDVPKTYNIYKSSDQAQAAHECIRPVDVSISNISGDEEEIKIYRFIWERYVASQMPSAVYDTVSINIKASQGNHDLKANGRTLKYKGWLAITEDFESDKEDDGNSKLPILNKDDEVILVPPKVKAEQKFTEPPPFYTEASLIKELEKRGLGRPSTYPTIMSKITDRSYVGRKKNTFCATDTGKQVVDLLVKNFPFMEYDYTANMELQLDQIAEGTLKYVDMMDVFYNKFKKDLESALGTKKEITKFKCNLCNKGTFLKRSKYGYFLSCETYPNCKSIQSCEMVNDEIKLTVAKVIQTEFVKDIICPLCSAGMFKRNGKFGEFYGCSEFKKGCKGIINIKGDDIVIDKKCDLCDSAMKLINGKFGKFFSCVKFPNCKFTSKLK